MSERELMSLVILVLGLSFVIVTAWARRGRSYRSRSWMYTPLGAMWTERMVILGAPTCGCGLLALSAMTLPPHAFGLELLTPDVLAVTTIVALVALGVLAFPLLYWVLVFIPVPDAFYPRWARQVRRDRRLFPQTSPSQPRDRDD
ncbi:hypothetical protein [Ruania halotolerans]|uniref:hypothetical protein n=1 Tax=Ruania halotolerans TaxID=2897773 RepID=UPI001E490EB2|nr:hypothetical protein [Ruania halotolerans]UFU05031.1 hypothetical protein LQF10_11125 [Ruania halotolerans]